MPLPILRITDPGCPFAYSAEPAMAVLAARYGSQIHWSLAMIGLAEDGGIYEERGYDGTAMAKTYATFSRRFGMPVTAEARPRPLATWPACRVVVATRLASPEREAAVQRALQVAWFTTTADLEQRDELEAAIQGVPGVDATAIVESAFGDSSVDEAFARDREVARSAAGSPTEAQGKHAMEGDVARYTAPSLLMEDGSGRKLEAGGFQPVEAYDVIIANADPSLERVKAEGVLDVLAGSDWPLCTAEVAAVLAPPFEPADAAGIEQELIGLAAEGRVVATPAGNGVFWSVG